MSIFKESFPDYVYNQLQIRKNIMISGDTGSLGRFGNPKIEYSGSLGGKGVKMEAELNPGAFFTYTTEKQCVIKMTSGVDLIDDDTAKESRKNNVNDPDGDGIPVGVDGDELLVEPEIGPQLEVPISVVKHNEILETELERNTLFGANLAKQYTLFGYVAQKNIQVNYLKQYEKTGGTTPATGEFTNVVMHGENDVSPTGTSEGTTWATDTGLPMAGYTDFANSNYGLDQIDVGLKQTGMSDATDNPDRQRSGIGNYYGAAYGDPTMRADAKDGYGIVPAPGIKDMVIQTKSAYGSLRTAKVNFVCYNRRQLEVLELLYMRPGYPILLEWGWIPYINNTGKKINRWKAVSDEIFFDPASSFNLINNEVFKLKKESNGNYDGFCGFVKNFKYSARTDGGYDCMTEIIAAGEILTSLQGKTESPEGHQRYAITFEDFVTNMTGMTRNMSDPSSLTLTSNPSGFSATDVAGEEEVFAYAVIPNPSYYATFYDQQTDSNYDEYGTSQDSLTAVEGQVPNAVAGGNVVRVPLSQNWEYNYTEGSGGRIIEGDPAWELKGEEYGIPTPRQLVKMDFWTQNQLELWYGKPETDEEGLETSVPSAWDEPIKGAVLVVPSFSEMVGQARSYLENLKEKNYTELIKNNQVLPVDNLELYLTALCDNNRIESFTRGSFSKLRSKARKYLKNSANNKDYTGKKILSSHDYYDMFNLVKRLIKTNQENIMRFFLDGYEGETYTKELTRLFSGGDESLTGFTDPEKDSDEYLDAISFIAYNVLIFRTSYDAGIDQRVENLSDESPDNDFLTYNVKTNPFGLDPSADYDKNEFDVPAHMGPIYPAPQNIPFNNAINKDKNFGSKKDLATNYGGKSGDRMWLDANFIRWDFLCELINWASINDYKTTNKASSTGEKLIEMVYTKENLRGKTDPETKRTYYPQEEYIEFADVFYKDVDDQNPIQGEGDSIHTLFNKSFDPTVCLFPTQLNIVSRNRAAFFKEYLSKDAFQQVRKENNGIYNVTNTDDALSTENFSAANPEVEESVEGKYYKETEGVRNSNSSMYPLKGNLGKGDKTNYIGYVYFNIKHITEKYKKLKSRGKFTLFKWIEEIWGDVNRASGNQHNFKIQTVHEEGNKVRVIDAIFENSAELKYNDLYKFDIQGQSSIVRSFKYNTEIPSAMTATIAIAAQAGDQMDNIDKVTFAAFNRNIKSRFTEVLKDEKNAIEKLNKRKDQFKENVTALFNYVRTMENGQNWYDSATQDSDSKKKQLNKNSAISTLSALIRDATVLNTTNPSTGQLLPGNEINISKSAIIPLKFTATLDGISGIVIGNLFQINPYYLPKAYQSETIAFIVTKESQKVTAGQDWTTTIGGQLVIKDSAPQNSSEVLVDLELKNEVEEELNEIDKEEKSTDKSWINPYKVSTNISSTWPKRSSGVHHAGIDLRMPKGNEILAPRSGTVLQSRTYGGYGYVVIIEFFQADPDIRHNMASYGNPKGYKSSGKPIKRALFAHLSKREVKKGDTVEQGDVIGLSGGKVGDTGAGNSTGPHLHYEVGTEDAYTYKWWNCTSDGESPFDGSSNGGSKSTAKMLRNYYAMIDPRKVLDT